MNARLLHACTACATTGRTMERTWSVQTSVQEKQAHGHEPRAAVSDEVINVNQIPSHKGLGQDLLKDAVHCRVDALLARADSTS